MIIRFTETTAIRGGAQYNPGEEADLPASIAEGFLAGGLAVLAEAEKPEREPQKPPGRGLDRPPADKMLRRGETQRKDGST